MCTIHEMVFAWLQLSLKGISKYNTPHAKVVSLIHVEQFNHILLFRRLSWLHRTLRTFCNQADIQETIIWTCERLHKGYMLIATRDI